MSKVTSALLGAALGAGGGFLVWHLTRDGEKAKPKPKPEPVGAGAEAPDVLLPQPTAAPPRVAGPCSLRLDKSGLWLEGESVTVATAVTRCKAAGRGAEVAFQGDGPASVLGDLTSALNSMNVPFTLKVA